MNDLVKSAGFAARDEAHAQEQIFLWVKECRLGVSDREKDALQLAALWGFDEDPIREQFAKAREFRAKQPATPAPQSQGRIVPASELRRRRLVATGAAQVG